MRVVTFNVHSCIGCDGKYSPQRIGRLLQCTDADIICLQEIESNATMAKIRSWSATHSDNQPALIAQELGMDYVHFSATLEGKIEESRSWSEIIRWGKEGRYGNAIISRYEILETRECEYISHPLEGAFVEMDWGEQPRKATACLIKTPEGEIWVVNTHLSHKPWSAEHRGQANKLIAFTEELRKPIIVCGDFNSPTWFPYGAYKILNSAFRDLHEDHPSTVTFPSMYHTSLGVYTALGWIHGRIDHVFAKGEMIHCDGGLQILNSVDDCFVASDHCLVYCDIQLC